MLGLARIDESDVRLVDEGRRLQGLARLLLFQPRGGKSSELVINQWQKLIRGGWISFLDLGQDLRYVGHAFQDTPCTKAEVADRRWRMIVLGRTRYNRPMWTVTVSHAMGELQHLMCSRAPVGVLTCHSRRQTGHEPRLRSPCNQLKTSRGHFASNAKQNLGENRTLFWGLRRPSMGW